VRAAAFVVALGVLAACSASPPPSAPDYSATTRDGARVSMADLQGRPALLTSWATWCKSCKTLLPALEQLHEDQGRTGIRVVAVNIDASGSEGDVVAVEEQYALTMGRWRDGDNDFSQAFRAQGVPTSVLVDADGTVVHRWPGGVTLDDAETRRILEQILRDDGS
jgi:cytochrome c biogenesis protein CcmG/thiol:disulfide interchange protein DsbE